MTERQFPPVQLSVVHGSSSSQVFDAPTQAPCSQTSPSVQGSPSSHDRPSAGTNSQPPSTQLPEVQALPSSQTVTAPPPQVPSVQVSSAVQLSPSSHDVPLGAGWATHPPCAGSQTPTSHGFEPVQTTATLIQPTPVASQLSSVHGFESSHWLTLLQPTPAVHVSVVQASASSQLLAGPVHIPPLHASSTVQGSPSSHAFPSAGVALHSPVAASQKSSVQSFPSSHTTGCPKQAPPSQLPPVEQAPLLHGVPLAASVVAHRPVLGSQDAWVHELSSWAHVTTVAGSTSHLKSALQVGTPLQALPSSGQSASIAQSQTAAPPQTP